jgi:hypothetical protein
MMHLYAHFHHDSLFSLSLILKPICSDKSLRRMRITAVLTSICNCPKRRKAGAAQGGGSARLRNSIQSQLGHRTTLNPEKTNAIGW